MPYCQICKKAHHSTITKHEDTPGHKAAAAAEVAQAVTAEVEQPAAEPSDAYLPGGGGGNGGPLSWKMEEELKKKVLTKEEQRNEIQKLLKNQQLHPLSGKQSDNEIIRLLMQTVAGLPYPPPPSKQLPVSKLDPRGELPPLEPKFVLPASPRNADENENNMGGGGGGGGGGAGKNHKRKHVKRKSVKRKFFRKKSLKRQS